MIPRRIQRNAVIIVIITCLLIIVFSLILDLTLLEILAFAQFIFSMLAFAAVLYTLYFTSEQFRKSMAKPSITVAFSKDGDQQATITYKDGNLKHGIPCIWMVNKGNSVARYFQIDFLIPDNIFGRSACGYANIVKDGDFHILSYTNEGRFTLFVNRPFSDPNMIFSLAFDKDKVFKYYKDSYEIKYRVYGNWLEPQEGALKININRQ